MRRAGAGASEQRRTGSGWEREAHTLERTLEEGIRETPTQIPGARAQARLRETPAHGQLEETLTEIADWGAGLCLRTLRSVHPMEGAAQANARNAFEHAVRARASEWMEHEQGQDEWRRTTDEVRAALGHGESVRMGLARLAALGALSATAWEKVRAWPAWARRLGLEQAPAEVLEDAHSAAAMGAGAVEAIARRRAMGSVDTAVAAASLEAWPFDRAIPPHA